MKLDMKAAVAATALVALSGCGLFKGDKAKTPVLGNRVPILSTEAGALADPTIAAMAVTLPAATVNPAWAQPGGNASKSVGHLALGASPGQIWSVRISAGGNRARLASAPVVADGRLYMVDVDAMLSAYDAGTGARLWSVPVHTDKGNEQARFGGGVSYFDGKLFATSGLGDVVAFNAADGARLWRAKPGGPLRGAPTLANGVVYVLSQDSQIFALNQADGTVQWAQSASLEAQGVFGVAAPASSAGTVVAGFASGELNAYRYENGRLLWQDALSRTSASTSVSALSDIDADPVIDQGRAYAIGQGGRLVSIDLGTGQRIWEQNFASIANPWVAGDWLFVVTDDARLICVEKRSGRVRWLSQLARFDNEKKKKGRIQWVGPVLAGDRLLLLNSNGDIVSASPADGSIQSTIATKSSFELPPVIANNTLYVVDGDGRLSAYR